MATTDDDDLGRGHLFKPVGHLIVGSTLVDGVEKPYAIVQESPDCGIAERAVQAYRCPDCGRVIPQCAIPAHSRGDHS